MSIKPERMSIIEKVIKLMALANGTTHTAEAESAKKMAAELMAKHDVQLEECVPEKDFTIDKQELGRKNHNMQESDLLFATASFNGVKYIRHMGHKGAAYVLVGRTADIEVTKFMYDILFQQMQRGSSAYAVEFKKSYNKPITAKYSAGYKRGFIRGVRIKLAELKALKESKIQEWGLVPVPTEDLALKFYNEQGNKTKTTKSLSNTLVLKKGVEDGRNASVYQGVTEKNPTLRIGR